MSTVEVRKQQAETAVLTAAKKPKPEHAWVGITALVITLAIAIGTHLQLSKPTEAAQVYTRFLGGVLGVTALMAVIQVFWGALRRWMANTCPLLAALAVGLVALELATTPLGIQNFRLLPAPHFPSPDAILSSMIQDRDILAKCAWHSFLLLFKGYLLGVVAGLVWGVCIGWFGFARYWGMPILKLLGPVPATAWVGVAMVVGVALGGNSSASAMVLIALGVWFPVTILTASGISNVRSSYLDVAKTLGASRAYLIFRVALPAAMPSIFIGLFMGLSASFLTLVVAESVGVPAGLGWYINWAQGWAEYGKVFGALVIMSVFFSSIMSLLFKLRDRVLVWQKGTIKW